MLPVETVQCPYCGESIAIVIDDSVEQQRYVEDCSVCCRPIDVDVRVDSDRGIEVFCRGDSEA